MRLSCVCRLRISRNLNKDRTVIDQHITLDIINDGATGLLARNGSNPNGAAGIAGGDFCDPAFGWSGRNGPW